MKIVKIVILIIVVWNVFAAGSALVLDKIDPYYAVQQKENELTEEELNAVCPNAFISEADKKLLLSVLNDAVVIDKLPVEYGDMLWLPEDDCERIISQYQDAPTNICRISVSDTTGSTYISIEFYETEDDKGSSPSTAYPCLYLNLKATDHSEYFYRKEVFNYSLKVPYNRIGTSSWGGPDATYHRYSCDTSPYGTPFEHQEKILTPMKHRHLYLRYFGWFEAMMSV
ncbi:MAG: hypothetical protein II997_03785 [Clostridia bacterium]|nr:hypothetical protein [Clostridia bacterium]